MAHLGGVQLQQPAHRGRSGDGAGRASGVEDLVVRPAEKFTHPDADLVAHHAGRQQIGPAGADGLGHCQRRRKHHRRRVEHAAVVHVVLLGEVRGRGIGHRRHQWAAAAAVDQDLAGPAVRPHAAHEAGDALHRPRALAGQRRGEPVEEQIFSPAQHRRRDVGELQRGGELGQLGRGVGGHRASPQTVPAAASASICSAV